MLRGMIIGFFAGPLLLITAVLLWSKAGLALLIAFGVLFGALVVAVFAGAAAGSRTQQIRRRKTLSEPAMTFEERQQFMRWRYGPPPEGK